MPEEDRQKVRVRIGLERGIAGRFARMAAMYDVRESYLVELAVWLGLPEVESRMELRLPAERRRLRQLDEILGEGGRPSAAGTAPAVDAGGSAGSGEEVRQAAEGRVEYHAKPPSMPRGGSPGGKKGKKVR